MPAGIAACDQKIVLTGFMGAGKTTVGKTLASLLGGRFDDLDDLVCEEHSLTVPQIFSSRGEKVFRESELRCLQSWFLDNNAPAVLALGGGAIETTAVREFLKSRPDAAVFYLHAPLPVLLERCRREGPERPLLKEAEERFARRANIYQQTGIPIATDGQTPQQVSTAILNAIKDAR